MKIYLANPYFILKTKVDGGYTNKTNIQLGSKML